MTVAIATTWFVYHVLHSNRVRGIFSCVYVVQYGLKWEDPRAKFGSGIEPPDGAPREEPNCVRMVEFDQWDGTGSCKYLKMNGY